MLILLTTDAYPQEQRCKDLGVSCICSEPLNTTDLGWNGVSYYNPADSTPSTKECTLEGGQGYAMIRNLGDLTGTNDSTVLSAFPPGHKVHYVTRAPWGYGGTWFLGSKQIASAPSGKQRLAARWYVYTSSDMFNPSDCGGAKLVDMRMTNGEGLNGAIISSAATQVYNFLRWTPAQDCCLYGPGPDATTAAVWQGHWVRAEVVISRPGGQGATNPGQGPIAQLFLKNVTRPGSSELTAIDTSYSLGLLRPTTAFRNPPTTFITILSHNHRQPNLTTGTRCRGFRALSHYMSAAWDTDEGQRIGAAFEIESGR